jgi:dual specificity phosphatase 3
LLATGWDPIEAIDLIRTARPIAAVGYAEDALNWWHRRVDLGAAERVAERSRLRHWRADNPHDTVRIIRQIRAGQRAL